MKPISITNQSAEEQEIAELELTARIEKKRDWYVKDYLQYVAIDKSLSRRTVKEYTDDLRIFFDFMASSSSQRDFVLKNIDMRTVREFLAHLKLKLQYSANGLNRKIASLRGYFHFLEMNQIIDTSPMNDIGTAKNGRLLPKVLTEKEVSAILTRAKQRISEKRDWNAVRDWAILELFYASGIRLAELVSIDLTDINFDNLSLCVTGKGNKQRFVFINESTSQAVQQYIACRPETKCQALFLNRFRARLSRRAVEIMFDKIKEEAGVFREASPHTMRHSFATHMLEGGSDLVTIKELLGHSSLSTTQIYTNISRQQMHETYKNSHPRKWKVVFDEYSS